MNDKKFTIGIDFGSLSARGVVVDVSNGETLYESVYEYHHGIMDRELPWSHVSLRDGWALQCPQDYWEALCCVLQTLADKIEPKQIAGIAIDCTSSSILPVTQDSTPLCEMPEFRDSPYAYIMMWKHHGAAPYAERMTEAAYACGEKFLSYYGGKVNSEWTMPRLLQSLEEAPQIYHSAKHYIEVMDWLLWKMTGRLVRNEASMGYKAFYCDGHFPTKAYLKALHPDFENVYEEKLSGPIIAAGKCAGVLSASAAATFHLLEGIPLSAGMIDAHAGVPACGITDNGVMLSIVGTSTCHIVGCDSKHFVPGISGAVDNGVLPGAVWYEAGQSSVGDCFGWFVDHCVPSEYCEEAEEKHISLHKLLSEKAERLKPGQSGLLGLDWWNGNRSILSNSELSGMILGLTLQTTPEDIYRTLIESTAFGAKEIIRNFQNNGVDINEIRISGGIALKNPMVMQIYADILEMPLHVLHASQGPALGSAIYAAAAAGIFPDISTAVRTMGSSIEKSYFPNTENIEVYRTLYEEYHKLHDYFGRGVNDVMRKLRKMRT